MIIFVEPGCTCETGKRVNDYGFTLVLIKANPASLLLFLYICDQFRNFFWLPKHVMVYGMSCQMMKWVHLLRNM